MAQQANMHVQNSAGQWVPMGASGVGAASVASGGGAGAIPASNPSVIEPWSYAGPLGGITDTADDVIIAAAGAGKSNYLTSLQISNTHASVDTEVVVKDGSTVIWRREFKALGVGPADIVFARPLISSNNTALNVAAITTGAKVYVNAQGYREASIAVIKAQQTPELEIFDDAGLPVTDDSGNQLYLA